jgi:hypothetical protein
MTLNASEIPIVKGNPSGMATIIKTTTILMYLGSNEKNAYAALSYNPILMNNDIINSIKIMAPTIRAKKVK